MIQTASQAAVHTETPQPRDRSLDRGLDLDPDPGRRASWHRAPNQEFLPLRNTSVLMLSSICHPETNEPGTRSEKKAPLAQNRKPSGQKSADEHNSWITSLVILSKLVETFHPSSLSPSLNLFRIYWQGTVRAGMLPDVLLCKQLLIVRKTHCKRLTVNVITWCLK